MKLVAAASFAAVLGHSAAARPDAPTCIEDHEAAGRARRTGALVESMARYRSCMVEACPSVIREECSTRAAEVLAATPTVVFAASDDRGNDLSTVVVRVDGRVVADRLDGRPHALDPGEHTVAFEARGHAPTIRRVVVRQGEKDRRIEVTFPRARQTAPQAAPGVNAAPGPPVAAYVIGGVGVAALAVFAGFAVAGKSKESELEGCSPRCAPAEVDVMQRHYLVADIALGVGAVGLGASAYLFLSAASADPAAWRATPPMVRVRGRF